MKNIKIKTEERLKLSDFKFYHFQEDFILNEELKRKGMETKLIDLKVFKDTKSKKFLDLFSFKFDSLDVGLVILKELLKENKELKKENFILGFDFFKTEFFNEFKPRKEVFERIKDDWSCYAKRCDWHYVCLVKCEETIYFIENQIETRFHYPLNEKNQDLFQSIVLPNKIRHFVHLNEFTEEELIANTPKQECFIKIENYFYNHFYNCECVFLNQEV